MADTSSSSSAKVEVDKKQAQETAIVDEDDETRDSVDVQFNPSFWGKQEESSSSDGEKLARHSRTGSSSASKNRNTVLLGPTELHHDADTENDTELRSHGGSGGGPSNINFSRHRRVSVSAEAITPSSLPNNWSPTIIYKTPEQLDRLRKSIEGSFLFRELDETALNQVIGAMEEVPTQQTKQGTELIRQGDPGDYFYKVERGSFDFYINGKKVGHVKNGGSFGELALMYNAPRAASVIATSDSLVWRLDRITFRKILLDRTFKKRSMHEEFLREVNILKRLLPYQRAKLADALQSFHYPMGSEVFHQGDIGERFYIVEEGTAKVIINGKGVVSTLHKGDYFGELALLFDQPRKATVVAETDLKVVTLDHDGFKRLLGPDVLEQLKQQAPATE